VRAGARLGGGLVGFVSAVYSDLGVRRLKWNQTGGNAPYKIVRRASDTGVGRSTSTAKFTIRSR
jgi:hypothetical protein